MPNDPRIDQIRCKNLLQLIEMFSPLNVNETARALNKPPDQVTEADLYEHYAQSGRTEDMRAVNGDENYWLTGCRINQDPRNLPPGQRERELWATFLADRPNLVPTFVPPCLRDDLEVPACYQQRQTPVCMEPDHPDCPFFQTRAAAMT